MSIWLNAPSGNWNEATSWSGGIPNFTGAIANFPDLGPSAHFVYFRDQSMTVGSLQIGGMAQGYYVFGNGVSNFGSGTLIMQDPSNFAAITIGASGSAPSIISSDLTLQLSSSTQIRMSSASVFEIEAKVTGPGHLNAVVAGTVVVGNSANNWTGGLIISSGTVRLSAANSLANGAVTIAQNGTLNLDGFGQSIKTLDNSGSVFFGAPLFIIAQEGAIGGTLVGTAAEDELSVTLAPTLKSFSLAAVNFAGWVNGEDRAFVIGNALENTLTGSALGDSLDGGLGKDSMAGGLGDDIYLVDNPLDSTVEGVGGGNDTVFCQISHTLRVNVEDLQLFGAANVNGTGNALDNYIIGNPGTNILNGLAGNDKMAGSAGNDTYYVDSSGDVVIEFLNSGIDIVRSSVDKILEVHVEKLYLLGTAKDATGNILSNFIYGNNGNNRLDGMGGADRITGYGGNDEYFKDSAGDLFYETTAGAAGGTDTVVSSVNHTLDVNFENIILVGAGNVNATGNTQANDLRGNSGINYIDGKLGSDTLTGGADIDNFVFTTALGASNIDTITDFSVANDTIRLDNAIFAALPAGFLALAAFYVGTAAADPSDRVIYNSATGALLYDSDGLGGAAAIRFATLATGLAMTNADVFVF